MQFKKEDIKKLYWIIKSTGYISSREGRYKHLINYLFKIYDENNNERYNIDAIIKKQFGLTGEFEEVSLSFFYGFFSDFGKLQVLYNKFQFSSGDIQRKFGLNDD